MRVVSLKLPPALDRRLTELASQRRTSRSAVLREALENYAGKGKRSVTALAGSAVGCVKGPRDLSTARIHLSDYGK